MKISLAGWSLHRRFYDKANPLKLTDFAEIAKIQFNIDAIELNNIFFESTEKEYLDKLNKAAKKFGVSMLNIAVDNHGNLTSPDPDERAEAVERVRPWFSIAKTLGMSAIRANTGGGVNPPEQEVQWAIESFVKLSHIGKGNGIKIIIENHGGLSGNPDNMVAIVEGVGNEWIGTLPDFGNFPDDIRYIGLEKIAPYAHSVHAKMYEFNEEGEDTKIDVKRCINILKKANYNGYLGIEFEGKGDDYQGIKMSKTLLEKYL